MTGETAIRTLITEIDSYLSCFTGPGITDVRAGIARWKDGPMRKVVPRRIRQTGDIDIALDWAETHGDARLVAAIRAAMPHIEWQAYDPYPRELIGDRFAENHCMASIIGEGGPIGATDFDLGLFGFGADILYRDHHHAASELYAPLTAPHGWRFKSGDRLDWRDGFAPVWNEAWAPHAFRSGPIPFLCIFAWTRDVDEHARMIAEPDWAQLESEPLPA